MSKRGLMWLSCFALLLAVAWLGRGVWGEKPQEGNWHEVQPGLLRSAGQPCGYALVDGENALLIDAPAGADLESLKKRGVRKVELVLLTHHHRDTCAQAAAWIDAGIPVRAAKASAEWLTPENVAKYWQESLPLRNSRTAYLVVPEGIKGIDCSLEDGQSIAWRGWTLQVMATPGHSRDHVAYLARKGSEAAIAFCGDALASPGKMWSPYTTDWDHWTDMGLKPAAQSLRKLAELKPALLCPAHGEPIKTDTVATLIKTAEVVEEVGFMKSFERYSKERLGNAPQYAFLAKEQAATSGEKPWSQISEHLFLTGNTYVLASRDNAILVMDPWGKRSVDQVKKLQTDRKLGAVELVMFSHAHYDHYDGVYDLPGRDTFSVWTLDRVAEPIADPLFYRAPFVDARLVRIDRRFKDGETATWREYTLRFRHFPGQSYFTMAVQTVIDGKKCVFTADNFFHADQFSGSGGWMGLNRSWPLPYAASAQMVLDAKPDWVLAEHGGAFIFNAEDFRRRVRWGEAAAKAADALSPSGNHRSDWDPHRVHVEPLLLRGKKQSIIKAEIVITNPRSRPETLSIQLLGRTLLRDWERTIKVPAGATQREVLHLHVGNPPPGRHVFPLRIHDGNVEEASDAFVAVEIEP